MLTSRKVTGKVILVLTMESTYVALKGVVISMASHMDSVENVVCKICVTVLAEVEKLSALHWQAYGWTARLAVSKDGGAGVATWLAAAPYQWATVPLTRWWKKPEDCGGALRDTPLGRRLLHHERLPFF